MTRSVERQGRTVEEAVARALADLGAAAGEVEVEVLEGPSRGLLGLFAGREARVRVTRRRGKTEFACDLLRRVAESLGLEVTVRAEAGQGYTVLRVEGDGLGILIGRRGQTLDALQYLTNVAAGRASGERQRLVLDVGDYRSRREETLRRLAAQVAQRVKRMGESVALEPMAPYERRIIHLALQGDPEVVTHSEGEEPFRRVVVSYRASGPG
ncbi:MAG: protein jag [Acetobacteraceae bacterium]|nr:protein jag [Acetobacteraceae bacterium]